MACMCKALGAITGSPQYILSIPGMPLLTPRPTVHQLSILRLVAPATTKVIYGEYKVKLLGNKGKFL